MIIKISKGQKNHKVYKILLRRPRISRKPWLKPQSYVNLQLYSKNTRITSKLRICSSKNTKLKFKGYKKRCRNKKIFISQNCRIKNSF